MEGINEETRKRSGDCLNQANSSEDTLPPNLVEICKPYHCGVCNEPLRSQLISTAHYAGTPHANNIKWELEIIKNGGKQPSKRKRDEIFLGKIIKPKEVNSFPCDVCSINLLGEETFKAHIYGNPHKKKLESVKKLENPKCFYCDICNIDLNTESLFKAHQMVNSHKKKLQSLQGLSCDVCNIKVGCEETLKKHMLGKPHKKKLASMKIKENAANSTCNVLKSDPVLKTKAKRVSCDVCNIVLNSDVVFKVHLLGKHHQKKLKLQKIEKGENADNSIPDLIKSEPMATPSIVSANISIEGSSADSLFKEVLMGKNVISALNELAVKNGYQLSWTMVSQTGPPHLKVFTWQLELGEHTVQGTGHSKKMAKNNAAEEMVKMLRKVKGEIKEEYIEAKSEIKADNILEESKEAPSHMESMPTETAVMINKNIPDLSDSTMTNLAGPKDIIKNKELKIKLKDGELLTPAEPRTLEKEDIVFLTKNHELNKPSLEDEDAASSDDDLIILENPDNLSSQKFLENTQNLNNAPVVESVKLCVYPLGQSESVTVSTQDYATLAYDTYLNDIIIDFYLLYLSNNVLSNSDREKVHIFSTMFYKRLMQPPGANAKKVPEYENDETLTPSEIRHFRVASWTKSVDLFEKDMIIIPICEESHWYLLLVVKPGVIFLPLKTKERKEKGEPFMIVLDSVGGRKNTAVKNIRRYLACEWNKKKCEGAENLTDLEQMGKLIDTVRPHKPEQQNNSDCGIFLLQYVDKVFQNVSAFLWPFLVNSRTREWFTSEEVGSKRGEIAQLIKRLTAEQRPGEFIQYPEIQFVKTETE